MTPQQLADLHARCFTLPRPWSESEFADLTASPLVFVTGDTQSFAMGRVIADEAELLTLATDPDLRRQGLGSARLLAFLAAAQERGASQAFLEVAAPNQPAINLYESHGFIQSGLRKAYYRAENGNRVDALVMTKSL